MLEDSSPFEDPQQPKQPPKVRFDLSQMETLYVNFFALAGLADELTIYTGANSPLPGAKGPLVRVSHRLMMTPPNAKRLMVALQQTIKAHEDRFGPIELPPQQRPGQGGIQ